MSYDKNPDGTYTDLAYTNFPAKVDSWQDSKNLTANYLSLANDYKTKLLNGNYSAAQSILNSNPELKRMLIGADDINKLKHSQMAIERLFTDDIEEYIKSYTDKSTSEADKATTSAANAAISEKNALNSEATATAKATEANKLVEDLRTLKGTLPTDFTEYTQQIVDAKEEFDNKIDEHNTSNTAHQDIRDNLKAFSLNVYTKSEADAKFGAAYTMTGATSMAAGKAGLVPAPAAGEQDKYLRGDGTWQTPTSINTWRGIQNNLTSTSTQDSLSAYQGKVLKDLVDKKAESNHTHNYAGANFPGGTALSVNGFTIRAQTTDPGAGSYLTNGTILLVYA